MICLSRTSPSGEMMETSGFFVWRFSTFVLLLYQGFGISGKSIDFDSANSKSTLWDPNYCNDTKLQEENELQKTALGQFLGYNCDSVFYHCRWGIDGWRTYQKTCRKGLVYDTTGTQNCNYDFNVVGCGMKQCADCFDDQYACCLSEECVNFGSRCDGKYDCTLEEDEQNCPTCKPGEFPCVISEECIPIEERCNNVKNCADGTDEQYCDECGMDYFYCPNTKKCIETSKRCDGIKDCSMGEDEAFCRQSQVNRTYICRNQVNKIPYNQVCDGKSDCPDDSDEAHCQGVLGFSESGEKSEVKEIETASGPVVVVNPDKASGKEEKEVLGKEEYFYEDEE